MIKILRSPYEKVPSASFKDLVGLIFARTPTGQMSEKKFILYKECVKKLYHIIRLLGAV